MPRTHVLKCDPAMFARLADGSKTFDLRLDDRGYSTGDALQIREFKTTDHDDCGSADCVNNWESPKRPVLSFEIGFIAKGQFYGLSMGQYAIISLLPLGVVSHDSLATLSARCMSLEHLAHERLLHNATLEAQVAVLQRENERLAGILAKETRKE